MTHAWSVASRRAMAAGGGGAAAPARVGHTAARMILLPCQPETLARPTDKHAPPLRPAPPRSRAGTACGRAARCSHRGRAGRCHFQQGAAAAGVGRHRHGRGRSLLAGSGGHPFATLGAAAAGAARAPAGVCAVPAAAVCAAGAVPESAHGFRGVLVAPARGSALLGGRTEPSGACREIAVGAGAAGRGCGDRCKPGCGGGGGRLDRVGAPFLSFAWPGSTEIGPRDLSSPAPPPRPASRLCSSRNIEGGNHAPGWG
jgi:hypothetical protein